MKPQVVVVLPRIEASMSALSRAIVRFALRFRSMSLPIPRELCIESLSGKTNLAIINEFKNISSSLARLWSWVPGFMKTLLKLDPSIDINCYSDLTDVRESMNTAIELARLVLRVKIGGSVSNDEWLSIIKPRAGKVPSRGAVVVIDDYLTYMNVTGHVDIIAMGSFIPTPVDLLYLVKEDVISMDFLNSIVKHVIKYIGDYIVYSRDLTEAYMKLLSDYDYMALIRKLGLNVII